MFPIVLLQTIFVKYSEPLSSLNVDRSIPCGMKCNLCWRALRLPAEDWVAQGRHNVTERIMSGTLGSVVHCVKKLLSDGWDARSHNMTHLRVLVDHINSLKTSRATIA